MEKKSVLLIVAMLSTTLICEARFFMPQSETYVYPDHFPGQTLQEAIWNDTVKDGDKIYVVQGTYHVHLNVNKSITVEGFDRYTTILDGDRNGTVVSINANNVRIFEFTIQRGDPYGVALNFTTSNCNVSRNIIMNNSGIGIEVSGSSHTLRNNDIKYNTLNFGASAANHDIDTSNKVDGKPICYLVNQQDKEIPLDLGYVPGYVALVNCMNITVKNLLLRKNVQGVLVASSTNVALMNLDLTDNTFGVSFTSTNDSRIENTSVIGGFRGLFLYSSNNNSICNSILSHYGNTGIYLSDSQNNTINDNIINSTYTYHGTGIDLFGDNNVVVGNDILNNLYGVVLACNRSIFYHNNFINNQEKKPLIAPDICANSWNLTMEGNYWDDITGADNDGDGINDPPCKKWMNNYNIDYHPLNETWKSTREINVTLWHSSDAPTQYFVTLHSDHVIASRTFVPNWKWTFIDNWLWLGYGLITFNITASTSGFCNVIVPRARLDIPIEVKINDTIVDQNDYNLTYVNATHWSLCFNYTQGIYMVEITGYRLGFAIGDVNGDGMVTMLDIIIVVENFGKHYP